ncbi:MAG TPA: SDR family oxidoreductase [Candidatus Cybelea sp.]|nr:SDR family oxidoreductase [Candidatus Cybelea sp.]
MNAAATGNALVTGAGQRIGRAIALELAALGYGVAVHYGRSANAAAGVVSEIVSAGGRAVALGADLSDAGAIEALVPQAVAALGPLTCLVNNASVFEPDSPETATAASWNRHMDVNLRAPLLLAQAFARQMPGGLEGNIINMIDQRVWKPTPRFASYTVSKAGLWTLTQILAMAFAPRIRVNGIGPGPVLPSTRQTAENFARQVALTPLGRGPSLDEIRATIRFLLQARSITGQMIALDGGEHLPLPGLRDEVPE